MASTSLLQFTNVHFNHAHLGGIGSPAKFAIFGAESNTHHRIPVDNSNPKQTTRKVHRLPAILLRRWQAEEIAKTPFSCVSHLDQPQGPNKIDLRSRLAVDSPTKM
jgi:hypothetical protein